MADPKIHDAAEHLADQVAELAARTRRMVWSDIADAVESLPSVLREVRARERLSLRSVAAGSGVPLRLLHRFEKGGDMALSNARLLLRWLADRGSGVDTS